MSKVVVTKMSGMKSGDRKNDSSVIESRVRSPDTGQFVTVRTIDGGSKTFSKDLTYVFTRNVEKARRDNKKLSCTIDRAPNRLPDNYTA
jgi:hypothetical protein